MYLVESKGGAIVCMLFSLFFLGTWPAVMTLLERRGRLPQHTYLDYTLTNLLAAVIIAFTLGEIGTSSPHRPNFLSQLSEDNLPSVLFAMAGGVVLSVGNLSTQYAWAFVGLSVVEVITSSITVVIGTTLNYFLDDKINKAEILFPGVGCFLIAVCLGSAVHSSNTADNKAKLSDYKDAAQGTSLSTLKETSEVDSKDLENGSVPAYKAKAGTAVFGKSTFIGLAITFFAGVCFSLFSPAFNLATNDQWDTLKEGVPHLSVYTAFFYFSVSCFVVAIILNITFLYHPVLNLPKSSLKAYLTDWNGRGWALLAGLLCGFGNGLQFMGGQAAGYAAADAVQALPLVSTFWGVVLFGEYRKSSRRTYLLLGSMLFMFIAAVASWKMYMVESKGGAIVCMLFSLFFLGTWPAVMTLLERRGRLPQHTYLDYTLTNLLAAVIIAFTFGEIGISSPHNPNFLSQLSQDNLPSVLFAMAGGVVLSVGNLSSQYAWAFVGLSVVQVIASSMTVVIGTTLNYFLDDKINKAEILFPGVGCFLIAVCLGSAVHSSNSADNKAKLNYHNKDAAQGTSLSTLKETSEVNSKDVENRSGPAYKAKVGTAVFLIEVEKRRSIKAGVWEEHFHWVGYNFLCWSLLLPILTISCFVAAIILNITFLYHPVLNLPKSSLKAYLTDRNGRGWALLAGLLCGFGNGLQFMGGQAAGYAAADAVQALPLVSTFWGVVLFGEYRKSSRKTYILLGSMLLMFIAAVAVLMASSGHRK
ncbi:Ureide permease [Sesbania bispinosa]|nr:Ureide permease [Sesbania bispinosa]